MEPTPIENLHKIASFTSPDSCRKAHEHIEKLKQTLDVCHSIWPRVRPKQTPIPKLRSPSHYPLRKDWPNGVSSDWRTWRILNRIKTVVAPVKYNLIKLGLLNRNDGKYDCAVLQVKEQLFQCRAYPYRYTLDELASWTRSIGRSPIPC